ncbi:hypothetical protein CWB41_15250 [Methylovirgula ligni]|uniref:Uncharacterized protein n=1 Tax=Methylovirgula ligni TaxID=569860 RepID=A0A3D9YZ33_9HYPH|nr:hypothetical protein [Methylovirgula ligni]QAY96923.1 hypothetical protein CWB41_15250 [Methylovirgula ligni]REF88023.1 hypothetical protein DES32_1664 [Methylovirgula ligni]
MATRSERLAEFEADKEPSATEDVELLCEDHRGTYTLPFPCRRVGREWCNQTTGQIIEAEILGWRLWQR